METIKRRNFLKKGALATSGVFLANTFSGKGSGNAEPQKAGIDKPVEPIKLSIMCYSFFGLYGQKVMDVFGFLESCKYRYDVQACELWDGFLTSTDEDYLKKVRWALDDREIKCSSLAWDPGSIWRNDPAATEKAYKDAWVGLKTGKALGANMVRIDAGGGFNDKEGTSESFDHIVKRYREYCQYAHDNGFKVGPEVHWGPETYFPNMKKLFEAVDHPAMGLLLMTDTYRGTPEEKSVADKESAKWTCATHLTWGTVEGGILEERMGFLRDAGYNGYWGIEFHGGKNEYDSVAVMLAKVRTVLEKWRLAAQQQPA